MYERGRIRQDGQDEIQYLVYCRYYVEQEKNVWARSDAIVACRRQARSVTGPDARSQQRRTWTDQGLRVWEHQ